MYLGETDETFQLAGIDGALILVSVAAATLGLVLGIWLFGVFRSARPPGAASTRSSPPTAATRFLYRASLNKWWFDELNDLLFIVIGGRVAAALWWFDRDDRRRHRQRHRRASTRDAGGGLRRIQTGPRPELRAGHRDRPARDGRLVPRDRGAAAMTGLADLPLVTLVTFLPLLGALVVALIPPSRARTPRATRRSRSPSRPGSSRSVLLARFVDRRRPASSSSRRYAWIPMFGIQYQVGVDGLSIVLVVLTTTLTWISILASFGPIQNRVKEYMISFLVLEVGMIGVFVAMDLFLFYIFWELVLVPMYLIIGIWGGENRIYATIKFVLYTLVGSLLMLVAILATAFTYQAATGHLDGRLRRPGADGVRRRPAASTATFGFLAFGAFFLAFAIKVPMFPFHTWLPDAHVEAPTAGSVILAGVLLKLGGYGFIRFALPLFPEAAQTWAPADHRAVSLIAIIYGAIVALVQPDLKKLVAYSSVSHMGFVTLGIFVFQQQGMQGAILQMVNHGLITGALFLLVGVIYERTHDRTIAKMGGLARRPRSTPPRSGSSSSPRWACRACPGSWASS